MMYVNALVVSIAVVNVMLVDSVSDTNSSSSSGITSLKNDTSTSDSISVNLTNSNSSRLHLPQDCGKTRFDNNKKRIILGDEATLGQFPYIARLGLILPRSDNVVFECAGSLINRYYLVTAAHCDKNYTVARLGEHYVHKDVDCDTYRDCAPPHQDIPIKKLVYHESYCDVVYRNDFGLVELQQPVEFNDFVQPICLPPGPMSHSEYMHQDTFIAGWGITETRLRTKADALLYIKVPIIDSKLCTQMELLDNQWCIGHMHGKDACYGDSGGPATMSLNLDGHRRNYLIGITSYGLPICGFGPSVYTDASKFLDWVLPKIERS